MIVVDASTLVELGRAADTSDAIAQHLAAHEFLLHAPYLIDVEILHALRGLVLRGEASHERITTALADLQELPITRHPHAALLPRAWELYRNVSAYDAMYVALAEGLGSGASILTADPRLASAARTHSAIAVIEVGT